MQIKKAYCDGPFGQIHYRAAGEGYPLVLCHQSPTCSVQFDAVLPLLAQQGIRAIAPDTPGFGMSDVPDHVPAVEDYSRAIIALIDHLSVQRLAICGHHTGSQVATEVALLEPKKVERLILHGPILMQAEEAETLSAQMLPFEKALEVKRDGSHMLDLWNWRAGFAEGYRADIMHKHVIPNLAAMDTAWYGHNACYAYDTMNKTRQIQQPCLVINNTGDLLYSIGLRAKELRPDFSFLELEGGTVDCIDEMPAEWSAAVLAFIKAD